MTSPSAQWRFGFWGMVFGMAGLPIYMHAPKFYSDAYAISLPALGVVLFALRLLDVIQDPLLGKLSAWSAPFGNRAIWGAGIVMAAGMVALFSPVIILPPLVWFAVSLTAVFSGFSFLYIRIYALGVDYYPEQSDVIKLSQFREAGNMVGVCLAAAAPTVLGVFFGYPFFGFALGFLASVVVAILVIGPLAQGARALQSKSSAQPMLAILRIPNIRRLLVLAGINAMPVAVTSTLFLFFVDDLLAAPDMAGPLLILFFLSAAASAPIWTKLALRFAPLRVLAIAMMTAIACFIWTFALGPGDWGGFAVICVLSGATVGADLVILPALFSRQLAQIQGSSDIGFACWSFVSKFTLALAAIVVLPALAWAGFDPNAPATVQGLNALSFTYALVPCGLKIAALAVVIKMIKQDAL